MNKIFIAVLFCVAKIIHCNEKLFVYVIIILLFYFMIFNFFKKKKKAGQLLLPTPSSMAILSEQPNITRGLSMGIFELIILQTKFILFF